MSMQNECWDKNQKRFALPNVAYHYPTVDNDIYL